MPGRTPMKESMSTGWRRSSLVRSAALRSGLFTSCASSSRDSGCAAHAASDSTNRAASVFKSVVSADQRHIRARTERLVQLLRVELALPAADDDGGDAIADEVGERAALTHELVDTDEDGERLDGNVGDDGKRRREGDETGAGDA